MSNQDLIANFTKNTSPEFKKIVERLVEILESSGEPLEAAVKWKQLTYSYRRDFHHWICGIAITKKSVGLVFHFGGLLEDPQGVFKAGNSFFFRKLEYQSAEQVDEAVVLDFVAQALKKLDYFKANWKEINNKRILGNEASKY